MHAFQSVEVANIFNRYPENMRSKLLFLRQLIFDTAAATEAVGALEETLKWGEPAYITSASKSGSTIRIDRKKATTNEYALYFNCQTTLVDTFKTLFPYEFRYEGNRAIIFHEDDLVPFKELRFCVALALTYHRTKKSKS